MLFSKLETKPIDPIIGLYQDYLANTNPKKVNLSIGLYFDEQGRIDLMGAARKAALVLAEKNQVKSYLPIDGDREYLQAINELVYGKDNPVLVENRLASVQTLAATGGLRITADALREFAGSTRCWVSDPTWSNHIDIFTEAGYQVGAYSYYNRDLMSYDIEALLADLENKLSERDVVLMHPVCHNPTGADLTEEDWLKVYALIKSKNAILVLDQAYLGYGKGIEEDALAVRLAAQHLDQFVHIFSSSKTFSIYGERIGNVNIKCKDAEQAVVLTSNLKQLIRCCYSTPICNGARLVKTILTTPEIRKTWEAELNAYRERLQNLRKEFVAKLKALGVDFSYIEQQYGFFSFLKLTPEQIQALKNDYGIYALESGRINFAGLNQSNIDYVTNAIAAVIKG
ncbi:hypothetical protein CJP74_04615 [Psittacicella melopsittaci]|uniref:Aminotransferase class I/classII large domain-containing protein n=1 Tax=Psittacicella melopsittaci TaxID=2028576 RepID=A0A3A1Y5D4_9GAMM|nr:aromatic amino acid transaminase [Psittacicella melopsittaci]RIY32418.1 hypothetical protein CJP74_04615 [Psittacicella melopsittaci]